MLSVMVSQRQSGKDWSRVAVCSILSTVCRGLNIKSNEQQCNVPVHVESRVWMMVQCQQGGAYSSGCTCFVGSGYSLSTLVHTLVG